MLTATRITYRINRFEIRAILLATTLSVIVSAVVIAWIRNSGYLPCLSGDGPPSATCFELQDIGAWATRVASVSINLAAFFPALAGVLLGAPLIARELDRGTARMAWSLGPSRMRWYAQRLLPILLVVVAASLVIGVVAEQLTALFAPNIDLGKSFMEFHSRGVLIATGGLLIASIATAVGAVLGRQVPAILLALVLGGITIAAISEVDQKLLASETVRLTGDNQYTHDLVVGEGRFELADGRLVTFDELTVIDPTVMDQGFDYPYVQFGIPRERYREIETREAVVQVALAVVFLGAGAVVVSRRRPG